MSDLRTKRTRAAIKRAFMTLRGKKPIEKISVKELAELAEINKATFYLHYRDLYDLSDQVENEILEQTLQSMHCNETSLLDPDALVREVIELQQLHRDAIRTVFSGSRETVLPDKIERMLRERLYAQNPELRERFDVEVLLSYMIQGSYRTYVRYEQKDPVEALTIVAEINHDLAQLYRSHTSSQDEQKG